MIVQLRFRRGTAAEWNTANPVLADGEPGYERDTGKFKIGNGTSSWTGLAYLSSGGTGGGGTGVSSFNGLTGDVVVTASDLGAALATHNHTTTQITGLLEFIQDSMSTTLLAGANITKTYDDVAGTITLASTGGGGGTGGVTSVNGQVGVVVLAAADVGAQAINTAILLAGAQTVTGAKTWSAAQTFSVAPVVPDGSFTIAKTSTLQASLNNKMTIGAPVTDLNGTIDIDMMSPNSIYVHDYNTATATWPARPTARTDIRVAWLGPVQPTVGGSGMLAGKDLLWLTP